MTMAHSATQRVQRLDTPPTGTLLALADRLRRLCPSRHDPEHFHVEKSAIEGELRQLAVPAYTSQGMG